MAKRFVPPEEQKEEKPLFREVWHHVLMRYYNDGRTEIVKAFVKNPDSKKKTKTKKKVRKLEVKKDGEEIEL